MFYIEWYDRQGTRRYTHDHAQPDDARREMYEKAFSLGVKFSHGLIIPV